MAEKSTEKNSDELDDLLQSALYDFDAYSDPLEPVVTPDTKDSTETPLPDKKLQEDFEDKFKNLFVGDVDDATFSSQMSNLLSEVQSEIQTYVSDSSSQTIDSNADTVSHAINSLMQNIEQIKENIQNESSDGLNVSAPLMEQMFEMLMSKEVLYPSLLSVKEKYPSWLKENKEKIGSDELDRYTQQFNIINRICVIFESECDSDSEDLKQKRFVELVALLQEMTDLGQPPQDLAESLPSGLGNEFMGADMDVNSCNPM